MQRILLTLALWGLLSLPAAASWFREQRGYAWAYRAERACYLQEVTGWEWRYSQWFSLKLQPTYTLIYCRADDPVAQFGGVYTAYKWGGDRREACRGDFSVRFGSYGKTLQLILVTRGSVPGYYCRDIGSTRRYWMLRR